MNGAEFCECKTPKGNGFRCKSCYGIVQDTQRPVAEVKVVPKFRKGK